MCNWESLLSTTVLHKCPISKSMYLSRTLCVPVNLFVPPPLPLYWWDYGGFWRWQENERRHTAFWERAGIDVLPSRGTTEVTKDLLCLYTNLFAFKPKELYNPIQALGEKALIQTRNSFSVSVFSKAQLHTVPWKIQRYFPSVQNRVILRTRELDFSLLASVQDG